ncbi:hypothetical protein GCM10009850_006550 [Nonomuraea monospora]|uniref:Uncharacterized protein n=1 Tax=Nonomuraea monospora TaxID=568818 RepID=A0ABN3C7E9_9ACTN
MRYEERFYADHGGIYAATSAIGAEWVATQQPETPADRIWPQDLKIDRLRAAHERDRIGVNAVHPVLRLGVYS